MSESKERPFITSYLQKSGQIIVDGALATELENKGCDLNDDLWSARVLRENPSLIRDVHKEYYEAGANVAITASYQATERGFAKHGLDAQEARKLISESVALAIEARKIVQVADPSLERSLFVAGSVGPYGAYLADGNEYRGEYALSPQEFKDFHRSRVDALVKAGVDCLACETIPSFAETRALVDLLKDYPSTPAWFSFTLRDESRISDGTSLREVFAYLDEVSQVFAYGFNCIPLNLTAGALTVVEGQAQKPLIVYPNSGETWDANIKQWQGNASSGDLENFIINWKARGARLIGGCCRTNPAFIQTVCKALKSNQNVAGSEA